MICPFCGEQTAMEAERCQHCAQTVRFSEQMNTYPTLPDLDTLPLMIVSTPASENADQTSRTEKPEAPKGLFQRMRSIFSKHVKND